MAMTFDGFDAAFAAEHDAVWRLCYVGTGSAKAAADLCFRSFLILGASAPKEGEEPAAFAHTTVLSAACELVLHDRTQKPRLPATAKRLLKQTLPFPLSEAEAAALASLMRLPLERKLALLLREESFTATQAAAALRIPRAMAERAMKAPLPAGTATLLERIHDTAEAADTMNGNIWQRFSERSVGFENKVHSARRRFDRVAPWLALAVLALFIAAYFYVEGLR